MRRRRGRRFERAASACPISAPRWCPIRDRGPDTPELRVARRPRWPVVGIGALSGAATDVEFAHFGSFHPDRFNAEDTAKLQGLRAHSAPVSPPRMPNAIIASLRLTDHMSPADWEADAAVSTLCGALTHREITPGADGSMNSFVGIQFLVGVRSNRVLAGVVVAPGCGSLVP